MTIYDVCEFLVPVMPSCLNNCPSHFCWHCQHMTGDRGMSWVLQRHRQQSHKYKLSEFLTSTCDYGASQYPKSKINVPDKVHLKIGILVDPWIVIVSECASWDEMRSSTFLKNRMYINQSIYHDGVKFLHIIQVRKLLTVSTPPLWWGCRC